MLQDNYLFTSLVYIYIVCYALYCQWLLLHNMSCFMWSPALNRDPIAGTTFLYKLIPSVNLHNIHQINIKCLVCNKTATNLCLICLWRTHSLFLVGRDVRLVFRYPYVQPTHVFSTERFNSHLFLLYYNIVVVYVLNNSTKQHMYWTVFKYKAISECIPVPIWCINE